MAAEAIARIDMAQGDNAILISPVSAWEIGLLARRAKDPSLFRPDIRTWFDRVRRAHGISQAAFDFDVGLGASSLPGVFHNDPGDRLLVATARQLGVPIVTRDRLILAYAEAGHVVAIAC